MKFIEVVAAILIFDSKILCVQRGHEKYDYISKKWEFPGGKVEENESLEAALKREILEELDIKLSTCEFFLTVNHQYPDFQIKMHSFVCKVSSRNIELQEHIDFKWLGRRELDILDWAEADLPIVEKLKH
tara:strand:- start:164 stop:553 length:390 start_codon:yes stop_codon:yes gene_type:complete